MTPPPTDILILGAGPAALSLAAAAADLGMSVACVAPDPHQPWRQNYGAWQDELAGLGVDAAVARSWPGAIAHFSDVAAPPLNNAATAATATRLDRGYVQISSPALQAVLQARCEAAAGGVRWLAGQGVAVAHDAAQSRVTLDDGRVLVARLVVDATGHGTGFLARTGQHAPAWQVAYGQRLRVAGGHPWPLDRVGFMDFRVPTPTRDADDAALWQVGGPTFLYVMPLDAEHVFVEETTLIARPAPALSWLAARLASRLAWMGLPPISASASASTSPAGVVEDEERCLIRMLGGEPVVGQRVLGFGASAGMVHPATGYLLPRVLRAASPVASALASSLGREGADPGRAATDGWSALWPAARRRQWALYRFGAEVLCALDGPQTQEFFGAYFSLPPALWQGFLSATLPPAGVARAMATMFYLSPPNIRRRLMQAGTSHSGARLLRGMVLA